MYTIQLRKRIKKFINEANGKEL